LCICAILLISISTHAQTVSFNNPSEWSTLRESQIVVKTLIDTTKVNKKGVKLTLCRIENGKKTILKTGLFKVNDYAQDFNIGSISSSVVGGNNYLRIEWESPSTKETGRLAPFGYAAIDSTTMIPILLTAKRVFESIDATLASKQLVANDFVIMGSHKIAAIWSDKEIGLVFKKTEGSLDPVVCGFDGKNGKNAFLAYSDRFIGWNPLHDSLFTYHYKRELRDTAITYSESGWANSIKLSSADSIVCISIPLYDLGVISFDNRKIGFAVFSFDSQNKIVSSLPANSAKKFIPATWGDLLLKKAP
jgi:hypothetical protein